MNLIHTASGRNVPRLQDFNAEISTFAVGTRKSKLALKQTELAVEALTAAWPDYQYDVKARDTAAGDIDKITPFRDMPVKNLWTHELEALLLEKKLDILIHSLKDVPTQLPPGCEIGAVLEREDPRDAFVLKAGKPHCNIQDLPAGAVVGTSSIRRGAQLALKFPHLVIEDMRGNINTRLNKLDAEDSKFDALILAAAGLLRIDLGDRISQYLDSENGGMLYAVGQGAIGIENRCNDLDVKTQINRINHLRTFLATNAERALLRYLEGGCSAPLGVETRWCTTSLLELKAIVVSTDGQQSVEVAIAKEIASVEDADAFGTEVAQELLSKGADKILAEIKAKKPTTVTDLEEK
ncbi:porphobilinogen deaminase [Cyphellophora europaea CBS 101466]|uniref:Porphobilinogen deaminase n=1 Tax=Cyphellophora europaea (strain CBS 101466) TaxID=1220924 RepID=W2S2K6_CYPE1|nr:porphobilinogen deaminase [Cyphellophora europaea CBS 101466]ETN42199.1 porphobilinogen deaminase [Cyphellophora europaea CBS 101466]